MYFFNKVNDGKIFPNMVTNKNKFKKLKNIEVV